MRVFLWLAIGLILSVQAIDWDDVDNEPSTTESPRPKVLDLSCRKWNKYKFLFIVKTIIDVYILTAQFTGNSICDSDLTARRMACILLSLSESKFITLKADHYDKVGNDPYDRASALDNIKDICNGSPARRSQ